MSKGTTAFAIDDAKNFDDNLAEFCKSLTAVDATLGPVVAEHLTGLLRGTTVEGEDVERAGGGARTEPQVRCSRFFSLKTRRLSQWTLRTRSENWDAT